jgi:hypothetical protein
MFKGIRTRWRRLLDWIEEFPTRRRYTLNTVIEEEDKLDQIEIAYAERAIVNHQYLQHMAEHRIKARAEWKRLQGEAHANAVRTVADLIRFETDTVDAELSPGATSAASASDQVLAEANRQVMAIRRNGLSTLPTPTTALAILAASALSCALSASHTLLT